MVSGSGDSFLLGSSSLASNTCKQRQERARRFRGVMPCCQDITQHKIQGGPGLSCPSGAAQHAGKKAPSMQALLSFTWF